MTCIDVMTATSCRAKTCGDGCRAEESCVLDLWSTCWSCWKNLRNEFGSQSAVSDSSLLTCKDESIIFGRPSKHTTASHRSIAVQCTTRQEVLRKPFSIIFKDQAKMFTISDLGIDIESMNMFESGPLLRINNNYPPPPFQRKIKRSPKKVKLIPVNYKMVQAFIANYLSVVSLDVDTVKFSSHKFTNNSIRDELEKSFTSYGELEFSWWTPDDMIFVRYISKDVAKRVYKVFKPPDP